MGRSINLKGFVVLFAVYMSPTASFSQIITPSNDPIIGPGTCKGFGCVTAAAAALTTDPGTCVGPGCRRTADAIAAPQLGPALPQAPSAAAGTAFPNIPRMNAQKLQDARNQITVPGIPKGPGTINPFVAPPSLPSPKTLWLPLSRSSGNDLESPGAVAAAVNPVAIVPTPQPPLRHGASPTSFDSGLTDCDTPFEKLASACTSADAANGRRCEEYSLSQFTEIVQMRVHDPATGNRVTQCTGTLLSPQWVLTAAHCVVGTDSASQMGGQNGRDLVFEAPTMSSATITADNVMTLAGQERERKIARAIVHGRYSGQGKNDDGVPFAHDLALLQLDQPFPAEAVEPARIASVGGFLPQSTLAGYGFSNADKGTIGHFNVTWPPLLTRDKSQFHFVPGQHSAHLSAFCQGDSGGPVLVGRNRGCRRTDRVPEYRPRYIQGVISYNRLGLSDGQTNEMRAATACMSSDYMAMQDVTIPDHRDWICSRTLLEAGGC